MPRKRVRGLGALIVALVVCVADARSDDRVRLLGTWRTTEGDVTSIMTFFENGTFDGCIREAGLQKWQFNGSWVLSGKWLHYTYTRSDVAAIPPGTKDRDELIKVDRKRLVLGDGLRREAYERVSLQGTTTCSYDDIHSATTP